MNHQAWLNGYYFRLALLEIMGALAGKKGSSIPKYPNGPCKGLQLMTEQDRKESENDELLRAQLYMNNMVRAGKEWGKK